MNLTGKHFISCDDYSGTFLGIVVVLLRGDVSPLCTLFNREML